MIKNKSLFELRDYQQKTIALCRQAYREGHKKILVALPTGAGKTEIFIEQIRTCIENDYRALVLVRRKSIVTQTRKRLQSRLVSPIGQLMGSTSQGLYNKCVASSIDTLSRRFSRRHIQDWLKCFNLIIVDEAHDATSSSYQKVLEFVSQQEATNVIGYTATPYRIGNKGHTWWSCCIKPTTAAELRDRGYLAPLTIYSPAHIDTRRVTIKRGEYAPGELYECVNQRKIYGNIIETYKKLANGKSALVFCVNKEHSRRVCESFREVGLEAIHCDCGTGVEERKYVLDYLQACVTQGRPFILCNVNVFSTGIDVPAVEVVIQARPTASKVLYIQQVGRALRTFNGKEGALLIDHGGNALRFGSPYDDHEPELTDVARYQKNECEKTIGHRCQSCGYYSSSAPEICPACRTRHADNAIIPKETEESLIRFRDDRISKFKKELYFIRQNLYNKGRSIDFAYHVLYRKHGPFLAPYLKDLDCPDEIRRWIEKSIRRGDRYGRKKAAKSQVKAQLYS